MFILTLHPKLGIVIKVIDMNSRIGLGDNQLACMYNVKKFGFFGLFSYCC